MLRDPKLRAHFHDEALPRLRLRQHHAPHRQHEHAAARRREPGHQLPRLAGQGPRRRRRELHAGARQSAVRRLARLRELAKDLQQIVKTKKTELLFLALFLRLLKPGGRAAVIVPDGVLFGSSNAHKELRRMLVEEQKLDGVVSLPGGVFKPYAGVSTAILLFTKTNSGGTDHVWFYDVRRRRLVASTTSARRYWRRQARPHPAVALNADEHEKNNLPDILARWREREAGSADRPRTAQSFCVPKADIAAQGYDLSLNRYKEVVHEEVEHRAPKEILRSSVNSRRRFRQG